MISEPEGSGKQYFSDQNNEFYTEICLVKLIFVRVGPFVVTALRNVNLIILAKSVKLIKKMKLV